MQTTSPKQPTPKATGLFLETSTKTFRLWAYPFPETRGERFELFLDGKRLEAARTEGKGRSKPPKIRHYTYIKYGGKSMYVEARLEDGSHVKVRSRT